MNRRELITMLGLGPLFHGQPQTAEPRCFGIIKGEEVEVECPGDEGEDCPLGHHQEPLLIIDLDLERGDEVRPIKLRVCAVCGVVYVKRPEPKEPSK
jgi:hypothetical protein